MKPNLKALTPLGKRWLKNGVSPASLRRLKARPEQIALFGSRTRKLTPAGIRWAAAKQLDVTWVAMHILTPEAWAAYDERATSEAWAACNRAIAEAWAAYERARAAYDRARSEAWAAYDRATAEALIAIIWPKKEVTP